MTFEISFMETICLAWIPCRWFLFTDSTMGVHHHTQIQVRLAALKSSRDHSHWRFEAPPTNLMNSSSPVWEFPSLHIQQPAVANPSKWIMFKAQMLPPASSVSASHPPPRSMGRGVTSRRCGFCFAPAIQDELPQTNWMVDQRFLDLYYIKMIKFFVVVSSCSSFHANLWEQKTGTFLVADHHIRRLWRR